MHETSPFLIAAAAIALIILGIIFCFRGYRNYKLVMVITGLGLGGYFAALLTQHPLGAVTGAILLAVLSASFLYFGIFMTGVLGGVAMFLLLNAGGGLPAVFLIFLVLAGGIAAIYFHKQAIVLATSLAGGLGMATGINLIMLLSNNLAMAPVALVMLALLFAGAGALFQLGIMHQYLNLEYLEPEYPLPSVAFAGQTMQKSWPGASASFSQPREAPPQTHSQMPFKLLQINGNHAGKTYPIPAQQESSRQQKSILGRSSPGVPVEVSVDEPTVSKRHAELIFDGETLQIKQLSQTNPTLVNNKPISTGQTQHLKINDIITLADIQLKLLV